MSSNFTNRFNRQTICSLFILLLVSIRIGMDVHYRFIRNEPSWNFERYAKTEAIFRSAGPRAGVFILFDGYTTDDASVSRICNDALYVLYPRPVLVGDPSHLAGAPNEILPGNVEPDDAWLRAHQIGSVLTLTNRDDDPPDSSVRWVQPPPANIPTQIPQTENGFTAALYLACCLVMGYVVVAWLIPERFSLYGIGLSAVLGPGVMGLCLMFFSMAGVRPSRIEICCIAVSFAAVGAVSLFGKPSGSIVTRVTRASGPCGFGRRRESAVSPLSSAWAGGACHRGALWYLCSLLAIGAIGYGVFTITITTLFYPTVEWDAFSIWQYKAKLLTLLPLSPQPAYFTTLCLSQTHLRYPILSSMISAGVNAMAGGFDRFARAPGLLFFVGLVMAIFSTIDRVSGRLPAMVTAALMMNLGVMYQWAGAGTAEMALTAFYGCSILCLLRWKQTQGTGDLLLTAMFSACMALLKNEGVALAIINLIVIALPALAGRFSALKPAAIYLGIVSVLVAPWQWYIRNLPRTDEDYAGRLKLSNLIANLNRLPAIFRGLTAEMLNWSHWGVFWWVLWILAVVGMFLKICRAFGVSRPFGLTGSHPQDQSARSFQSFTSLRDKILRLRWSTFAQDCTSTLWILLLLHLLAYVPPMMVSNWKLQDLLTATADRLLMHAIPLVALVIGITAPEKLTASDIRIADA